jgi:AraC family transcriptional regulator
MASSGSFAPMSEPQPDFLADALAYIEAHLFDALSVRALADVTGLSPYHFSRMFTARFGMSPIAYVRARRLLAAARRLEAGDASLAELAFDCGFESQEAFTRAFKREYGVPPGEFRRAVAPLRQTIEENDMSDIELVQLEEHVRREAFSVAGLRAAFDESNKSGIPALWPRLLSNLPLAGQVDGRSYGVIWTATPGRGSVNYMAGVEVRGDTKLPAGFEKIDIAAQTYIVFRQTLDGGPLHPQLQAAAREIWGKRLPKLGVKLVQAPDFELCPEGFNPMQKGAYIDVYVPVVL